MAVIFGADLFLVVGVHKRRINFINVWLVLLPIAIIPFQIYSSYILIYFLTNDYHDFFEESVTVSEIVRTVIILLFVFAIYLNAWLSIYSLRKAMQLGKPISLNWSRFFDKEEEVTPAMLASAESC